MIPALPSTSTCGTLLRWYAQEIVIFQYFLHTVNSRFNKWSNYTVTHNACYGDAGGPLVLGTSVSNYIVVGLVSHSSSCFSPTAYIRLSFYTAWMRGIGGETSPMPTTLLQTSTTTTTVTTEIVTPSPPATTTMAQTTTQTTQTTQTQTQTSNTNVDITTEATTTTGFFQTCNVASAGQFPFVVSVGDLLSGRHSCAGFIYNANYVVTTASCVEMWVLYIFVSFYFLFIIQTCLILGWTRTRLL